jgi:hypothetical protein
MDAMRMRVGRISRRGAGCDTRGKRPFDGILSRRTSGRSQNKRQLGRAELLFYLKGLGQEWFPSLEGIAPSSKDAN